MPRSVVQPPSRCAILVIGQRCDGVPETGGPRMVVLGIALGRTFHTLLLAHPLLVIALVIGVEELGIPSPIPGDVLMLFAGVLVAQHRYPLWLVLAIEALATLAGASGLFFVSRRLGRPFALRYGRFLHLTPERLTRVEGALHRHGARAVVAGRLIPSLRTVTPIAAGVLDVPY